MARTPSMTALACEQAVGPRGNLTITSDNRGYVQKWLVACGVPAVIAKAQTLETLRRLYNDTSLSHEQVGQSFGRNYIAGREANTFVIDELIEDDTSMDRNIFENQQSGNPKADAAHHLQQALSLIAATSRAQVSPEQVKEICQSIVADAVKAALAQSPPLVIEVRQNGDLLARIEGKQHKAFPTILKAATARDASGFVPNVWIAGPAGSGKTRAVHEAAKALKLDFEHNGALAMPHELTGFIDAGGKYHGTAFRRAYENGRVYLFDEVDASDNAALLAMNAALANGSASFPDASIDRHKDSRIFVAANTWGFGATAEFVGRARLDAAFLDRFPVKVHFDYDEELETAISGNADWSRRVQKARAKARDAGLKVAITPRASIGGAALIAAGFSTTEAAGMTYLANLTNEQRKQVEG